MENSAKIKIAVSATIRNQIEMDIQDYQLKGIGELCNKIIELHQELASFPLSKRISRENCELFKNSAPLQFILHKRNGEFATYAVSKKIKIATLCRHYLQQYVDMPRGKREIFLKKVELSKIDYAIENQLNVWLDYHGKRKLLAPCFVALSPAHMRAYLVICERSELGVEFKAFRLSHVKNVEVATAHNSNSADDTVAFHTQTNALYRKSLDFKNHFDPFLCYGQELKVELSPEGVALYNRAATNRPKILKAPQNPGSHNSFVSAQEEIASALDAQRPGIYIFECSPELAKVYFPQFLETAQVLAPAELRHYFRQRFLKAASAYGLVDQFTAKKV